jgi:general secretion pathway protein G
VVLIGLSVICLLFFGVRTESVRVSQRAREAILQTDLRIVRDATEHYTLDNGRRPKSLQDLVDAGYLRAIPISMTGKTDWVPDFEGPVLGDPVVSPDLKSQGLHDVTCSVRAFTTSWQLDL